MKALKRTTKEELIRELTNTRKQLKGAREALDNEVRLRRSDVEEARRAMQGKLDTASCQYREWKELAEKYQSRLVEAQRDRDFFRRVLEKMSR